MSMPEQDQLRPDLAMITDHIRTAKGDVLEGLFEVVGLKEPPGGGPKKVKSRLFSTDQIEEAAQFATDTNAEGYSLYMSAAILSPDTAPMGRPNDNDFFMSNVAWADFDHEGAAEGAAEKMKQAHAIPWYCVDTGMFPYRRVQMFLRTDLIHDPELLRSINSAIAQSTGGDPTVVNPSRFMRLGGTIAWPSKPGRVPELTRFYKVSDIEYPVERLQQVFGGGISQHDLGISREQHGISRDMVPAHTVTPANPFNSLRSRVPQGQRDLYMARCVMRATKVLAGTTGCMPDPHEVVEEAWPPFEHGTGLERSAYEERKMLSKAKYLLRKIDRGIGEWKSLDDIVADYQREHDASAKAHQEHIEQQAAVVTDDKLFPVVMFDEAKAGQGAHDFVEDTLTEGGMSVVYGDSNTGKTFWGMHLGLHVAMGRPWNGKHVDKGAVIHCALEGGQGVQNRIAAFRHENAFITGVPYAVIPSSINLFDSDSDVATLVATIRAVAARLGEPVKLVIIDTLARAMAGGNENASQDMGAVVRNADAIRQATGAHVMFVHHTGKDQARGARGHSSLRAATDTEIEVAREQGAEFTNAKITKQRDMEGGQEYTFRLKVVEIGVNSRGKTITSCVVEAVEHHDVDRRWKGLSGHAAAVAQALKDLIAEAGEAVQPTTGHDTVTAISYVRLRSFVRDRRIIEADNPDTFARTFRRAADILRQREIMCNYEDLVWIPAISGHRRT